MTVNTENYDNGAEVPLPENICPKCGRKYPIIENYCSECGIPLAAEGKLEEYRKTEEQRKQYEAEQKRRAEEERRRQSQRIERLEEENRRLKQEKEENKKGSGGGIKALIFAAIIAAAGIIYVNQKKAVPDTPYVPPVSVAENKESEKDKKIAQLENQNAELSKENKNLQNSNATLSSENSSLKKDNDEKGRKLKASEQEKSKLAASAEKAKAEVNLAGNHYVGEEITMGSWRYYADGSKKTIKWKIMEINKRTGEAVLLSWQAIDNHAYHSKQTDITWAESDIRKWLN